MPACEITFPLPLLPQVASRHFPSLDTWLRLNPQWSLLDISAEPEADAYRLSLRDEHSEQDMAVTARFAPSPGQDEWLLQLSGSGPSRTLRVRIEADTAGSRLIYREEGIPEADRALRTDLALWHRSLADYIQLSARRQLGSRILKFLLDRIWLRMSQPGRRIAFMVIVSELAGLGIFLLWLVWTLLFG